MTERPILFSGPMVRAILDGRKIQTRRLVKPQPSGHHVLSPCWGTSPDGFEFGERGVWIENGPDYPDGPDDERRCPYGVPGDRLWVRETWYDDTPGVLARHRARYQDGGVQGIEYRASHDCTNFEAGCPCNPDGDGQRSEWRPSIFMPRWASRITLEVTDVRVERLLDITDADARAEGCAGLDVPRKDGTTRRWLPRVEFAGLWDETNGKKAPWSSSPWVWVIGFRRIDDAKAGAA